MTPEDIAVAAIIHRFDCLDAAEEDQRTRNHGWAAMAETRTHREISEAMRAGLVANGREADIGRAGISLHNIKLGIAMARGA